MIPTHEQIKAGRLAAGLTVPQAAEAVGVSESTWRKWEGPNCGRYPKAYSLTGILILMAATKDKRLAGTLEKYNASIAKIENRCPSCKEPMEDPAATECPHCGQQSF